MHPEVGKTHCDESSPPPDGSDECCTKDDTLSGSDEVVGMGGWHIGRHPPFSGTKSKRLPKQRCGAASERQAIHRRAINQGGQSRAQQRRTHEFGVLGHNSHGQLGVRHRSARIVKRGGHLRRHRLHGKRAGQGSLESRPVQAKVTRQYQEPCQQLQPSWSASAPSPSWTALWTS